MTAKPKTKTAVKKRKAKKAAASPAQRLRVIGYVFLGFALLSAAAFAALFVDFKTLPTQLADAGREAVRSAGFRVEDVEVRGARRFSYEQITDIAKVDMAATVFGQNLAEMQENLEKQIWIESARVTRKLPNVLAIHVAEYEPFARWQLNGALQLVDTQGQPFMRISRSDWRQLPLIVGQGAPEAAGPLARALTDHPNLSRRLASATRIGNRRWDLAFRSGAVVKLPEDGILEKLSQLSRMQAENNLLDGAAMRIDMRMDQMLAISTSPGAAKRAPALSAQETAG